MNVYTIGARTSRRIIQVGLLSNRAILCFIAMSLLCINVIINNNRHQYYYSQFLLDYQLTLKTI